MYSSNVSDKRLSIWDRTLDYEFSYGDEIVVTPRKLSVAFLPLCRQNAMQHYAMIGMAHVADGYPLYYDAVNEKGRWHGWI